MTATGTTARLERVQAALARAAADWLLVPASPDFRWLTGARARATERLVAIAVPARGDPFAVVPALEAEMLGRECPWLALEVWTEAEDPIERLERRMGLGAASTLLLGEGLRVSPLLRLAGLVRCRPATEVLGPLRAVKDAQELAALERAAGHADAIVEAVADRMAPGMTEQDVARMIFEAFEAAGDDGAWAIVAAGANSALPHHFTSGDRIREDDVVMLDLGAVTDGYVSDITRTYFMGTPPAEFIAVFDTVNAARAAAIAALKPGVTAESVDRAARSVIEAAGHGAEFVHRTGHGVGLEVHEPPYIVAGNRELLRAGMTHSVEPGIYLPGAFGVRLEDLVAVTDQGARRLNRAPIDWRVPRLRT